MHRKKVLMIVVAVLCLVAAGAALFFIFRKVDYPILKKTRIGGERYIREIYPELEIRYPEVDVNRDNAECIVSDFYSDSVYGNSDDNSDTMRRINIIAYSMPELFKDKDIEKFSLRAANASIIITNDKRKTLSSEKNKKRRYTSKWVDVDPDNQENLKFYIVQSIPVRLYGENLYQSKEVNGEKNDAVEKINKCVIEVKLTYKDGREEQQYLVFSTASRGDVSPFSIYRADSK